jgi:hypothetical protein
MSKVSRLVDLIVSVSLKLGIILAFTAFIIMYLPLINKLLMPLLKEIRFWETLDKNPDWVKILTTGVLLVIGAFAILIIRKWVEELVDILFGKDKPQIPTSSL